MNQRPLPPEGSALSKLSYAPIPSDQNRALQRCAIITSRLLHSHSILTGRCGQVHAAPGKDTPRPHPRPAPRRREPLIWVRVRIRATQHPPQSHRERRSQGNDNGLATEVTEGTEDGHSEAVSRALLCDLRCEGTRRSGGVPARRTSTSRSPGLVASGRFVGGDRRASALYERSPRAAGQRAVDVTPSSAVLCVLCDLCGRKCRSQDERPPGSLHAPRAVAAIDSVRASG